MITLNVNSLENAEIFWKELGLENEIALNETFDPAPQTLALSVDYIDGIYEKIVALELPVSPIVPSVNGRYLFSFIAPEGNIFIIIGEWVEEPYTGEKRATYFDNIKSLITLEPERLTDLSEDAIIYFGRVTCPWCRRLSRQIAKLGCRIYYVDTEDTELNPQLQAIREQYHVPTVPTVIKRFADGTFVKFDSKVQTLAEFVN